MRIGRTALATGVIVAVTLSSPGWAHTGQFPTVARNYVAWMVRAMDQCDPATLTVIGATLPSGGCLQSNTATDDEMTLNFARLIVSARTGRVFLFGRGLTFGGRVLVRLTLRVTKAGVNTKEAGLNKRVTFEDVVVDCPSESTHPFGFPVRVTGVVLGATTLAECLSPLNNLAGGNIEILDAALVNKDNGKVFARPGILR